MSIFTLLFLGTDNKNTEGISVVVGENGINVFFKSITK